jgi:inner membrane protein
MHWPARGGGERSRRVAVAVGAVVAIGALDRVGEAADWPVVVVGLLDEPAHLLTAYVLLLAMGRPLVPDRRDAWALAGAVLIDVDHLPQFLGFPGWAVGRRRAVPGDRRVAALRARPGHRARRPAAVAAPRLGLAALPGLRRAAVLGGRRLCGGRAEAHPR